MIDHTKAQHFCFYVRDDDVHAMQFKLLYISPGSALEDGILMWQDNIGECMLSDGEPKPCTPFPMRNGLEILMVYPYLLNIRDSYARRTSPYLFMIPINH